MLARAASTLLVCALLAGCGQKGPLVAPPAPPAPEQPEQPEQPPAQSSQAQPQSPTR